MSNPYETPSAAASAQEKSGPKGLTKWLTIPMGFALGAFTAGLVQIPLMLACLMTPIASWVRLNGEFDGLFVFAFPIITSVPGAFAGTVLGIAWRSRYRTPIAYLASILPAVGYFFSYAFGDSISRHQPDMFISTTALSVCMALATAAGVWYTSWIFRRIERGRGLAGGGLSNRAG